MALANAKVAQIMIPVDDLDRGIAFYRYTLGLPFLFTAPPPMAFFNCGGVRPLIGVLPQARKTQRGSAIHFQIADIRATVSAPKHKGVHFAAEPQVVNRTPKAEVWLAECNDPDGNPLALMSEVILGGA